MRRLLLASVAALTLTSPALADYTWPPTGATIKSTGTATILPWASLVDQSFNTVFGTLAPGAAPTSGIPILCQYLSGGITLTNTQVGALQCDAAGGLRVGVAQGSTTTGQAGPLMQGAVTTSSPSYTTAQTSPISLDTAGNLRVNVVAGSVSTTVANYTATAWAAQQSAGTTTARIAIPGSSPPTACISNVGSNDAYLAFGNSSVVATVSEDVVKAGGQYCINATGIADVAFITASGSTLLNISSGAGNGQVTAGTGGNVVTQGPNGSSASPWYTSGDPCAYSKKAYVDRSLTASTQILTGTSSNKTYICNISFVVASGTPNVSLVEGTGSVCATNIASVFGNDTSSTIAANGLAPGTSGGISQGDGTAAVATAGNTLADNLCVLISGTATVNVHFGYVQAP